MSDHSECWICKRGGFVEPSLYRSKAGMPGFYPLHFVPMTQARRVGVSAWIAADEVIRAYALPILAELVLQLVSYAYDLLRYRRIASLHAYSAKLWGASLYVSAGALIAFRFGPPIWVSFALGCVSFVDALAIKLILPGWRHDVLSCFHAWKQRGLPPTVGA